MYPTTLIPMTLFIYIRSMTRPRFLSTMKTLGAWMAAMILMTACASGPRYGAARKQKKGCDCPHWNAVKQTDGEAHASVPNAPIH